MSTQNDISQEELEFIERYLKGDMNPIELDAFEQQMARDTAFAKKVSRTKTVLATVQTEILRTKLDGFHETMATQKEVEVKTLKKPNRNRFVAFAIAASIATLFSMYLFTNTNNETDKLYAKYFVADPGLPNLMGANDNYSFNDAMVDYKMGDYKTATKKWKNQLPQKPENDTLNYFLGVSQLASGDIKEAIPYLQKTVNNAQSSFAADAYFYLGLAQLKEGNTQEAKTALQKSTLPEARELVNQLKK
ncbi:MAG: tetratricopeptide repeat protein [Nonlabens sp.]|nr:tetratricopeptide repeat protein [Nonlabens sp.]